MTKDRHAEQSQNCIEVFENTSEPSSKTLCDTGEIVKASAAQTTESGKKGVPMRAPEPDERPDLWPWNTRRSVQGALSFGGVDTLELAKRYQTPVYVYNLDDLFGRAEVWKAAMDEAFWEGYGGSGASVYYAGKAFLSRRIVRELAARGLGIDCASLGELSLALEGGAMADKLGLHGNNKSDDALRLAVENRIARIVIDSLDEVDRVDTIAGDEGVKANVMIRVTTGVHAGGHEFIATAHEDQKFGLSLATGAAYEAAMKIREAKNLNFVGLHSHIGSQILDIDAFAEAARRLLRLRKKILDEGMTCPEVDLGGGYAICYHGGEDPVPVAKDYADALAASVKDVCAELQMAVPHVSIEPGRSIAGPAAVTLYEVGTVKDVTLEDGSIRRYVSVDGGMSDNIRPALYGSVYTAVLANRLSESDQWVRCRVVGSHCESGDIVIDSVALPGDICRGDLLAVPATGAYGKSMASNYNMMATPAVVGVSQGVDSVLIRRRDVTELLAEDVS